MPETVDATMELLQSEEGWLWKLTLPDGTEGFTEQRFETRDEAHRAFRAWAGNMGIATFSEH